MVLWHALNSQRIALVGIAKQISQIRQFYLSWIHTPQGGFLYSTIDYALRTGGDRRQQSLGKTDEMDRADQCGLY
jgi:hypothetical protein